MSITAGYNHESNWLAAVLTVLQHGGTVVPTAHIQIGQSLTVSRSPRIEIEVESDATASDQMAQTAAGEWYFSHRACLVTTRIVTARTAATTQNHGAIRGRVRWLYSREAQRFTSPAVTWYVPLQIDEQPSNVYVRDPEGDREDVTELRHRIEYGILPAAVPTV